MLSAAAGLQRGASTSSMRSSQRPPWLRAERQLPRAARTEPKCRGPVGDGAKRPTTGSTADTLRTPETPPACTQQAGDHTCRDRNRGCGLLAGSPSHAALAYLFGQGFEHGKAVFPADAGIGDALAVFEGHAG